ncbi:MAG: hypothetical protein GVY18_13095 [Bacteroidetes bacterium]|jgi:hypothetical protein|nr:hypothetical protein [Bacteroidota bacterium]
MTILVTAALALGLHLLFGWPWTIAAGVVGGLWVGAGGWRVGALGVGLDWAALIVYNYVVAPEPVATMTETVGGILGNMPGAAVVACTLFIGLALGALGGAFGAHVRRALDHQRGAPLPTST